MPKKIDIHTILRWIYSSMSINVVVVVRRNRYHLETEIIVFRKCKISKISNATNTSISPNAESLSPDVIASCSTGRTCRSESIFLRALTNLSKESKVNILELNASISFHI